MSQAKVKEKENQDSSEKRKKIWLGVLGLVFVVVIYIQFFSGDDARPTQTVAGNNPSKKPSPTPTPRALRPGEKPEPIITQPLMFAWFGTRTSGEGTGRNIFVYPTPTPEPPPTPLPPQPTPVPPPILLSQVQPTGVLGRTGDFTMTLYGDKFPADAQGFVEGRPYETKVSSQTELKVQVPGEAIMRAGSLGVQVRSKSDAQLYSNQLSLSVASPPPPNWRYIGRITNKNEAMAILKSEADDGDVVTVTKGQKFDTHWLVISITPQKIVVQDLNIPSAKITHDIAYSPDKG